MQIMFDLVVGIFAGILEGVARSIGPLFETLLEAWVEIKTAVMELVAELDPLFQVFSELGDALGVGGGEFDLFGKEVVEFVLDRFRRIKLKR